MRALFDHVHQRLENFIVQRDDLALVIACSDSEAAVILRMLEGLEELSSSELFWFFPDEFSTAEGYVSQIVHSFSSKHEAVRLAMEDKGMPPWPAMPDSITGDDYPAVERLRKLIEFGRALLPQEEGLLAVWAFFPLVLHDAEAYSAFMAKVLQHDFPFPWCHHTRVFLRGKQERKTAVEALAACPRIGLFAPDLSTEAIEKALNEEVEDPSIPLEARMQSLLMTAGMDYAQQRYPEALQKYQLLTKFYGGIENPTMAALSLNGMGEVYRATEDLDSAGTSFEAAVIPASQANPPPIPVLVNITINLANVRALQKRWHEAEICYANGSQLSAALRNVELKIQCHEQCGVAQFEQGKTEEALHSWRIAAALSKVLNLKEFLESARERLRAYYQDKQDYGGLQRLDTDIEAMASQARASMQQGPPSSD